MPCARLRNWSVFRRYSRTHSAVCDYVTGDVYGSDRRPDGTRIVTSAVVDRDEDGVVTSSGDRYVLEGESGAPDLSASVIGDATSYTR